MDVIERIVGTNGYFYVDLSVLDSSLRLVMVPVFSNVCSQFYYFDCAINKLE